MPIRRIKVAIDSCWAKHMSFRVAFVAVFLFSIIAISVYAFVVFRPFSGWLGLVLVAVYVSGKYRTELKVGIRRKFWWLPLTLAALSLAFTSYSNYILGKIDSLLFSALLCLISVGFLIYYSTRKVRLNATF